MAEEMKEVLLRLKNLEDRISAISVAPKAKVSMLTEAEVKAYHKVATALWEDGTCGINETSPCIFKCNVVTKGKVTPIANPRSSGGVDLGCWAGQCLVAPCTTLGNWGWVPGYGPGIGRFSSLGR